MTTPENSTPSLVGHSGAMGYLPSRCETSIRFSPKAFTRTITSDGLAFGMAVLPMYSADAGPTPLLISERRSDVSAAEGELHLPTARMVDDMASGAEAAGRCRSVVKSPQKMFTVLMDKASVKPELAGAIS